MNTIDIDIEAEVDAAVINDICKQAVYCHRDIVSVKPGGSGIRVELASSERHRQVENYLEKFLNEMLPKRAGLSESTIRETDIKTEFQGREEVSRLLEADVFYADSGLYLKTGRFLQALELVDNILERTATEYGAEKHQYNSLIPAKWLGKASYFTHFPQSITFAVHLAEDYEEIKNFSERHEGKESVELSDIKQITQPECCLSPAVCFHSYGYLAGKKVGQAENGKVITAKGKCFRYESVNMKSLSRMWEFTMREIVFVGDEEFVLGNRERLMEQIWRMVTALGVEAKLQTANDPFFSNNYNSLRFFQLRNEYKYELCLPLPEGGDMAVASFNYHEDFFGSAFDIKRETNTPATTGCVAFGLERLIYGLFLQLGVSKTINMLGEIARERADAS